MALSPKKADQKNFVHVQAKIPKELADKIEHMLDGEPWTWQYLIERSLSLVADFGTQRLKNIKK